MGKKNPQETLADETDQLVNTILEHGVDGIIGGFPCQDISYAGKGAGLAGKRSGLWWEMVRTIRLLRPKFAIVENVPALLNRGMGTVLGDLAESGYDTEWGCISAAQTGAPHLRERIWIIANNIKSSGSNSPFRNKKGKRQSRTYADGSLSQGVASDFGSQRREGFFQRQIQRQPEFSWCKNVRRIEDFFKLPDIPEPLLRRTSNGITKRLHGIGNGNPPCIIRELTRGLK